VTTRRLTRLSGSKLHLAMICGWAFQPDVAWVDSGSKELQAIGNATHECIEAFVEQGSVNVYGVCEQWSLVVAGAATPAAAKVRNLFLAWHARYGHLDRAGWVPEAAFVYDPEVDTIRFLGKGIDREYEKHGKLPHEIPCSIDLFFVTVEDGIRWANVYDWKTGLQRNLGPAGDSWQLRFGGFCVARFYGCERARLVYVRLDEGDAYEDVAEVDSFALEMVGAEVAEIDARTRDNPQPNPGPHCSDLWCPAYGVSCPATTQAIAEIDAIANEGPRQLPIVATSAAITSPDHARSIWLRLKAIDAMSAACWEALNEYASRHPFEVERGRIYAAVDSERESIAVNDRTEGILEELLGEHADGVIEIRRSASKEAIKAATLAKVGKGGKQRAALEREILDRLRKAGSTNTSKYLTYTVVKMAATDDGE
jgi:hypothetical protein